jgi:hypothetical protein
MLQLGRSGCSPLLLRAPEHSHPLQPASTIDRQRARAPDLSPWRSAVPDWLNVIAVSAPELSLCGTASSGRLNVIAVFAPELSL